VVPQNPTSVVIADTSVIINLCHTGHLLLLGRTATFEFVVPDEVVAEVTDPDQRRALGEGLAAGALRTHSISSPEELTTFAELTQILGAGEAACLAVAENHDWLVACDERRLFLREARRRLGDDRILNTAGLYVLWIRAGIVSVAEADLAKGILESHRFRLAFNSFRDVI
jgi:predicted nucleic acid-binding protein